VELKHSLTMVISVESFKFKKDNKTNKAILELRAVGVGYRTSKQTKTEFIISKTNLTVANTKTKDSSNTLLSMDNLELFVNNQNFNDIRRLIALIAWHNSFVNLPCELWLLKPPIIGEVRPLQKMQYISNIIYYKIKENRLRSILEQRRLYISVFDRFRKNPNDNKLKE
jgi:hypothetical protein